MSNRYFKKHMSRHAASDKVQTPNGHTVEFSSIDGLVGYWGGPYEPIHAGLVQMINEQRGGVSEIPEKEYMEEYAEKKKAGVRLRPFWREELAKHVTGNTPLQQLGVEHVQAVVAMGADNPAPAACQVTVSEPPPSSSPQARAGQPPAPFVPRTGKRGKPKQA